jgi:glycosyltransferase involved in cell wall biosynthesis
MNILLVTPRWTRDGGVAAHVISSAAALAQRGLEVDVATARIELDQHIAGVTVHHCPDLFNVRVSPEMRLGAVDSLSPSIVHLHQFEDPDVAEHLQARAPLVVSVHGYSACTSGVHYFKPGRECPRAHGPGCIPNLTFRGCAHTRHVRQLPSSYRRASDAVTMVRRADMAVSYSSAIDRHLSVNGVIRRGIVPYFPTTEPAAESLRVERRSVVFAGRIVAAKGVGVLVRAARSVDAEFVICGDGPQLDAMRKLATRLDVADRVRFEGWLEPGELSRRFAQASVVVLPSVWPEPFGLVGIEALAAGRPVVASATGGVGDWLEHGVSGLCVRPGDPRDLARALNELLADPARQSAMGESGRKDVTSRFSRERHLATLTALYESAGTTWRARGNAHRRRSRQPSPPEPSRA